MLELKGLSSKLQNKSLEKVLVLCPLKLELNAVLNRLKEKTIVFNQAKVGKLSVYEIPELQAIFSVGGQGKAQFAIQTQYLLNHIENIGSVICAGSAGGLDEKLRLNDVVLGIKTIEHDFHLKFFSRPKPEFEGNKEQIEKISRLNSPNFQTFAGSILSGDEDIIDTTRAKALRHETQALAVAWEGAGGARACLFNSVPFLEVRGITDMACSDTPVDFKLNLVKSMSNVCDALLFLIKTPGQR